MAWLLLLLLAQSPTPDGPILILPVDGPPGPAAAMEAELARAIRRRLGDDAVTTHTEIDVALTAERTKDVLGCDDVACLTEILGALGGRFALAVTVAEGEPLASVTVILRDLGDANRVFRIERRAPSIMPARMAVLAEDLAQGIVEAAGWRPIAAEQHVPAGGSILVNSDPEGARVLLNDRDIGVSPLALSGLVGGKYELMVGRRGYRTHREEIALEPGARQQVSVSLSRLVDWHANVSFGFHGFGLRSELENPSAVFLEGGALYGRQLWGPISGEGIVGYSALQVFGDGRQHTVHGAFGSAGVSIGGCLCFSTLASFTATTAADPTVRAYLDDETTNLDWSLVHGRFFTRLTGRTQGFLTAEIGVEVGMLSIIHLQVYYSPILIGGRTFEEDDLVFGKLARHGFGVRIALGFSAFHRRP